MSRFDRVPLTIKMALVALPLALVGVLVSSLAVTTYKDHQSPRLISAVTQNGLTAILGESTTHTPTEGYTMPTTCPAPYTGTPPNCQPPAGSTYTAPTDTTYPSGSTPTYTSPPSGSSTDSSTSSGSSGSGTSTYTMPTTCPSGYSGTPPNCQPAAGTSQSSDGSTGTNTSPNTSGAEQYQGSTGSSSQSSGSQYVALPPTFTKSDSGSCMERLLGAEAYARFQAGGFQPTGDQIAKASSCFNASVSYGPSSNSGQGSYSGSGGSNSGPGSQSGQNQPIFANIPIAPPPAFQSDSPALACAKSVMGDRFGSPTPELISQVQSRCFATASSGQQIGFIDPSGQYRGDGPTLGIPPPRTSGEGPGAPPSLPPEVKACVIKAGMSETTIAAISRGQSPTAAQQQQGESCFSQYAKDKGYTPPMLTPPDPTQPFDPNSKQNQCADLVAQTHGIRVSQINPAIVTSWSAADIGKLRSCYGVSPTSSAGNNTMAFAPTSPQVAISSSKLSCIETAVGGDKLAAVMAGTANMSQDDRKAVYDKCINPTKIASDPALLGMLAAMPPSDLEGLFIPIDSQILPAPTAAGTSQSSADAEVAIGGEVNVAAGTTLPTKVDVFVKSTPQTFTVELKKITDIKAVWTMNLGQNKLALGNHKAYAVATLADATQTRSPDASFDITAAKTAKSNTKLIAGIASAAVAVLVGAWLGWRWHTKKPLFPRWHWHRHA